MRRIVASGAVVALMLGLSGCGGDADSGVPKDAAKPLVAMTTKLEKMKEAMKATKNGTPRNGTSLKH